MPTPDPPRLGMLSTAMRGLGVGLVYWSELQPLFVERCEAVSVLELEPETLWTRAAAADNGRGAYRVNRSLLDRIAALPQHKLVHGVGHPIGGSVDDPLDYRTPFAEAVDALQPAWASEHLSFNRVGGGDTVEEVSFLLPPRQTAAGARQAARNLRRMAARLPVPVAFETGVNYLQPRTDELSDGAFCATVAEEAQCGIVLDLHNLWANERNGREPIASVLDRLPLAQVWEIHLAGGMELDGYWLDAHSDLVPPGLIEVVATVIPRLPNLAALIFEILPQYVPTVGLDAIHRQLEQLQQLWKLRTRDTVEIPRRTAPAPGDEAADGDVLDWEASLAAAALGRAIPPGRFAALQSDRGTGVLRHLITEFRSGRIVRALRYTMLLLLLTRGREAVREMIARYCRTTSPNLFVAAEADRFARFLRRHDPEVSSDSLLAQVFAFEEGLVRASLYGETTHLTWRADPSEVFQALDEGRLPTARPCSRFAMTIEASGDSVSP